MSTQPSPCSKFITGFLLCVFLLTTGCYSISKEFPISQGKVPQYLNCLKTKGGDCTSDTSTLSKFNTSAVRISSLRGEVPESIANRLKKEGNTSALSVLDAPVQKKIIAFYDYLNSGNEPGVKLATVSAVSSSDGTPGSKTYSLEFDSDELRDYQERIEESVQSDGWEAFESSATSVVKELEGDLAKLNRDKPTGFQIQATKLKEDIQRAKTFERVGAYVKAYLAAYFRNGEFFKVSVETNENALKEKLKGLLKSRFPQLNGTAIEELAAKAAKELFGKLYFGDIGTTGFVTRSGDTYQFPPLEARLDPLSKRSLTVSKIDFAVVGADLVRVILEGTFDAISGLPAVSNATGFKNIPAPDGLPLHDPETSKVDVTEFGNISSFAGQTEAASSTAFGQLIRGLDGSVSIMNIWESFWKLSWELRSAKSWNSVLGATMPVK